MLQANRFPSSFEFVISGVPLLGSAAMGSSGSGSGPLSLPIFFGFSDKKYIPKNAVK
jgi:hypothetical protein